ncbi:MAG: glycosyltransferase [Prolixibacteraceae bacterium]|jgi:glycosyltransferase involved in cell wall biosynthesis
MNPDKLALKKVSLSVINDLVTDNRVHKVVVSLKKMGFEPVLVGRLLSESQPVERDYQTRRMKLLFRKGPLFYFEYNLRLFFFLLKTKIDVFVANDLDTLPANFLAARLKRKPLIYDSHEYFTEVPELIGRPVVRAIWTWLEKLLVPGVDAAYTVCDSIAEVYNDLYKVDFKVVRNLPVCSATEKITHPMTSSHRMSNSSKIILYQGALNQGRGLEAAIRAMKFLDGAELWIAGDGDITEQLKLMVAELKLDQKVKFLGRLPLAELSQITRKADLGISLEEDLGLNYRFALPNKLFDYIQAGVPVLVSNLPEMRKIVEQYRIGAIAETHQRKELAETMKRALFDQEKIAEWKQNLQLASSELCWENEEEVLQKIYLPFK